MVANQIKKDNNMHLASFKRIVVIYINVEQLLKLRTHS
jgi:hypothetical protein